MLVSGELITHFVQPDISVEDWFAMKSEASFQHNLLTIHNLGRDIKVVVHLFHALGVGVLVRRVIALRDGSPGPGGGQVVSEVPVGVGPLSVV